MQRAGLAVAKLALAIAPHSKVIWIPCGPGNNGGDGLQAAAYLKSWGKIPVLTGLGESTNMSVDAATALRAALEAGVVFADSPPDQYDLCIDALFGIGQIRPIEGRYSIWIQRINTHSAPVLAVDIPSGLEADTGVASTLHVRASYTLSLLTLKPGLFTADGRAACGEIWFNNLEIDLHANASAHLGCSPALNHRAHNSHKGSYGDVCVIGGSPGMAGAALLAARAAIRNGAGRVFICMLDKSQKPLDACQPELMFRDFSHLNLAAMTVVAGCGGGEGIHPLLPRVLAQSARLVLDADALNAIAKDASLQNALTARPARTTVLTPHPLEAARLMNITSAQVQADRLGIARAIATRFACTVVLKGSGTVIANTSNVPCINTTGNARLATAGTGDVLAGMIGARFTADTDAFLSACESVFRHGALADEWHSLTTMTSLDLVQAL